MTKGLLNIIFILVIIALFGFAYYSYSKRYNQQETVAEPTITNSTETTEPESTPAETKPVTTTSTATTPTTTTTTKTETKKPTFVSSIPAKDVTVIRAPETVSVTFDTALVGGSDLGVVKDGTQATTAKSAIEDDKKTISVPVSIIEPGTYTVVYKGCSTTDICTTGSYTFTVSRTAE